MKEYNKLVRDRIPEIMINKGCKPVTRILNDEDYLNELNNNIYSSWFVHMFANFAINTVGFILFGVI